MQTQSGSVVAIDLGATSGRVIVGHVDADRVRLDEVARFPNGPVAGADGTLRWDLPALWEHVLAGLREALRRYPDVVSIGVDSWAVDYGLLVDGTVLGSPVHYRADRHTAGVARVHARVDPAELYRRNGLQHLPFNTVFQLAADPDAARADRVLLVPDLIGYLLTGEQVAERTNASTTGLLDARTRGWDPTLVAATGLQAGALPPLRDPGDRLGTLLPAVARQVGARADLPVTLVGSHDTASAVVAVPTTGPHTAYVSSGTWSLVGVELDAPLRTDAARVAGCTNEGGVDGRVRFLRNVSGLWLLSESVRTWEQGGERVDLEALLASAARVTTDVPVVDPSDDRFTPPGDMPARIAAWCVEHDLTPPATRAEVVRSILESLAAAYASTLDTIEDLTGQRIDVVHVVGGGSRNTLLCRLTADRSGRRVVAGPVEATAFGNVLVQARAAGLGGLDGATLEDLRARVVRSVSPTSYSPTRQHVRSRA